MVAVPGPQWPCSAFGEGEPYPCAHVHWLDFPHIAVFVIFVVVVVVVKTKPM